MSRKISCMKVVAAILLAWSATANSVFAQGKAALNAAESDPKQLGWMTGFPPPSSKLIGQPDSNYFSFPKMRWTVCHLRELLPTKVVNRGLGSPVPLPRSMDDGIDAVTFKPLGSESTMSWKESLAANYTDGIVILHKGRIVYERYFGCLEEAGKHGAMSMTKSMTGSARRDPRGRRQARRQGAGIDRCSGATQ